MDRLNGVEKVGLRDKETNKLIAVYPHKVEGTDNEIEDRVKFWYYQQSCEAENRIENSFVDVLTPNELKNLK